MFMLTNIVVPLAHFHTSSKDDEASFSTERIDLNSEGQNTQSVISQGSTVKRPTTAPKEDGGSRKLRWDCKSSAMKSMESVKSRVTKRSKRTHSKLRFAAKHKVPVIHRLPNLLSLVFLFTVIGNQASLRVDDSQWSDRFSLDTVGSSGRVNCRTKERMEYEVSNGNLPSPIATCHFFECRSFLQPRALANHTPVRCSNLQIGVKIDLSSSGLTKIVTLMPYFMIVNKANVIFAFEWITKRILIDHLVSVLIYQYPLDRINGNPFFPIFQINLECIEADEPSDKIGPAIIDSGTNDWIRVPAGEAVPFWPQATNSKKMLLRCRVAQNVVTDVFPYYESHSILMKLPGKYIGVFVEVETTEEATVIILQTYQEGMALVRIINHLGDCQPIHFQQRGVNTTHELEAGMSVMYAWDCARSERELQFYCNKSDSIQCSRLTMVCPLNHLL
ncbi:hypothetical protein FBUS_10816 [Fasciolopsis buskii]|uniref:Vacuolar protein sorting-associated protein 13 VPS13 adaptor binding domain-containing protein n=1 Tax=Fasciolopsis buskii TaxID=27845 RepID=A0A8E0RS29_9TREM|nr:hypothetical protein FBUS_10816 [Fasciolopsis buski]